MSSVIETVGRCSGILLHPTSLPGPHGIGTLGKPARQFVDFLQRAGQTLWQVCPLGVTGYGNSPYQCLSAFAGNPLLIDLEQLVEDGWLDAGALPQPVAAQNRVDYGKVITEREAVFAQAYEGFIANATSEQRAAFDQFCTEQAHWLDDFALFVSIKNKHGGRSWQDWDAEFRLADAPAIEKLRDQFSDELPRHRFIQWVFSSQWQQLKQYANEKEIRMVGDIPIFVALDSVDVWRNRDLFQLDAEGRPTAVAGVPPDYFSETGQLWGNPLYDWDRHAQTGFRWWIDVIRAKFQMYDLIRIDHFRGFAAYWSIPAGETTAINGSWVTTPGERLFAALEAEFGSLPIIAEDLGIITQDVVDLRTRFGFPGMKVLQFAFDSAEETEFRPHTYEFNSVVYSGTHDNNTVVGWCEDARPGDRDYAFEYLNSDGADVAWDFLRTCWASPAALAIAPLQDVLRLGPDTRMNTPATIDGNWEWCFNEEALTDELAERLRRLSEVYVRYGDALKKPKSAFAY